MNLRSGHTHTMRKELRLFSILQFGTVLHFGLPFDSSGARHPGITASAS